MSKKITNEIVLITGASSGIGAACAKIFAQHGAKLILCARRLDHLQKLAQDLEGQYNTITRCVQLDVRNEHLVQQAVNALPGTWQNITLLVNNAGLAAGIDKLQDALIADWQQMIDTNISGLLYVTRAVINGMINRGKGHIINIGSVAGHEIYSGGTVYAATKHAVNAITRSLRLDLCGTNVRVSSIDPGMTLTEFSEVRFKGDLQRAQNVYAGMTPLAPEDVADAVYYCASRPAHVNITELVMYPTDQAGIAMVNRKKN